MPTILKRNAIAVLGLAALFCWAFGFVKHDPRLRNIIPFGEDPYDAVGSFGFITAGLLALVSLARTFLPRLAGRSGTALYVLRAQAGVAFCVLVTIASNAVAMSRHVAMWINAPGRGQLLTLLGFLTAASLAVLRLLRYSSQERARAQFVSATVIWLGSLLVLWLYPEQLITGTLGHLFTVLFGALLLFAPVAMLVNAWFPSGAPTTNQSREGQNASRKYLPFAIAMALGLVIGAGAFLGEMIEGGSNPPFAKMLFVAAVYLGLGMTGLLIGYALLGRLLGFVIDEPKANKLPRQT